MKETEKNQNFAQLLLMVMLEIEPGTSEPQAWKPFV